MLKAITMNYVGRNRAWGGFSPQGARPSAGSLSIMVGDTPRTWLAQYGASGFLQETHTPVWKPTPQQAIPDADKQGSLDPLSAALSVGLAGDAACDARCGPTTASAASTSCSARSAWSPPRRPAFRARKATCWSARCTPSACPASSTTRPRRPRPSASGRSRSGSPASTRRQIRYPGKLEAQTVFATIRGRLLYFRERPLTQEESQAMKK